MEFWVADKQGSGKAVGIERAQIVFNNARKVRRAYHSLLGKCVELKSLHFLPRNFASEAPQQVLIQGVQSH